MNLHNLSAPNPAPTDGLAQTSPRPSVLAPLSQLAFGTTLSLNGEGTTPLISPSPFRERGPGGEVRGSGGEVRGSGGEVGGSGVKVKGSALLSLLPLLLLGGGCLEAPAGGDPTTGGLADDPEDGSRCIGCAAENDLRGELMLFINGKLSDHLAQYTAHRKTTEGRYVGSGMYLYDPARKGHLVYWGRLDLGVDPREDKGWRYFQVRNAAYSPQTGLWLLAIDKNNDEWRLSRVEAPNFRDQRRLWGHVAYALRTSDPAYNEEELTGLAAFDGVLWMGGRGSPSRALPGGPVYRCELPQGFAVDPSYPTDPEFYADRNLCVEALRFPPRLGVAGDLEPDGEGAFVATSRGEHADAAPLDRNLIHRVAPPAEPQRRPAELPVVRNDDFHGLAHISGTWYAIDTGARVYRLSADLSEATLHDDLSGLFADPANGLRVRGATTVVAP